MKVERTKASNEEGQSLSYEEMNVTGKEKLRIRAMIKVLTIVKFAMGMEDKKEAIDYINSEIKELKHRCNK